MAQLNKHLSERLLGIQMILKGVHQSGKAMTSSSIGTERQAFIDTFLAAAFPNIFRFGQGDAIDLESRSGQLDVVIEYPFSPSLPIPSSSTRLYLAESIAAVIEVKSNISSQWEEVKRTANQLAPLNRKYSATMVMGKPPTAQIPLYVVSYTGWTNIETLEKHLSEVPNLQGILIIESGLFVGRVGIKATGGAESLRAFISCLHQEINSLKLVGFNPLSYFH